jgi:hypothetical protein
MSEGIASSSFGPEHPAELVAWLVSPVAAGITGRVFNVGGGHISIVNRWHTGPSVDKRGGWSLSELDEAVPKLAGAAAPHPDMMGFYPADEPSAILRELRLPGQDAPASKGEKT